MKELLEEEKEIKEESKRGNEKRAEREGQQGR